VTVIVGGTTVDGVVLAGAVVGAVVGVVLTEVLVGVVAVGWLVASASVNGWKTADPNASTASAPASQ